MVEVVHVRVANVRPVKKRSYGHFVGSEAVVNEKAGLIYFNPMDATAIEDAVNFQRIDPCRFEIGLPSEYFYGETIERAVE